MGKLGETCEELAGNLRVGKMTGGQTGVNLGETWGTLGGTWVKPWEKRGHDCYEKMANTVKLPFQRVLKMPMQATCP